MPEGRIARWSDDVSTFNSRRDTLHSIPWSLKYGILARFGWPVAVGSHRRLEGLVVVLIITCYAGRPANALGWRSSGHGRLGLARFRSRGNHQLGGQNFCSESCRNSQCSASGTGDFSGVRAKNVTLRTEIGFSHLQIRYINDDIVWKGITTHHDIHEGQIQ